VGRVPCRSDRGTGPVAIITLCGGGLSAGGTVSMSAGEKLGAPRPTSYAVLETRGSAALLRQLEVRRRCRRPPGAAALLDEARELVQQLTDPGVLPALVVQAQRPLITMRRHRIEAATPVTERELAVLRLLPTQLSSREIAQELSVSVNTVRSQIQAIYRKLQASTRAEAVAHARELGLLPGSRSTATGE
jgi:ATP/maltotriose-dependent transcriptional regulator MalT